MKTYSLIALFLSSIILTVQMHGQNEGCKPTREMFIGTVYYTGWTSNDIVANTQGRLIQSAKKNCSVVHFHGANEHVDLQRYVSAPTIQSSFDVRLVLVRKGTNRSDTIAFGLDTCMKVNGRFVPLDVELLNYVAVRIPCGFSYPILEWIKTRR